MPTKSGKEKKMKTQFISNSMKGIYLLFVILAALSLSSCSTNAQAKGVSCSIDMGMHVTIDATDVRPRVIFDQLAVNPDCAITVSPFVWRPVTLHVENATVTEVLAIVCPQIGCKYFLNYDHLWIKPITVFDKWLAQYREGPVDHPNKFQNRLPEGMSFQEVLLSMVLKEISNASGLTIKPWMNEGDRKVTINVSSMTVNDALQTVLRQVNGEGAVLVEVKHSFPPTRQYWLWNSP
jgi:hypothetical protein